jgi:aminoglycoside phosphotransferase (APT) family kinase protein
MPSFAGQVSRLGSRESRAPELPHLARPDVRARLLAALRVHWRRDVEVDSLRRAEGGFSSETWFVDVTTGGRPETVVLRRQALVGPLEPYDLGREVALVRALAAAEVPVAEIYAFCEDEEPVGAPFVVMRLVEGDIPEYRALPEYPPWTDPANRSAMARECVRKLAAIQRTELTDSGIGELLARGEPDEPPVAGRVRWILDKLEYQVGADALLPVLRETASWLCANASQPPDAPVLVHGDYKVGNFVWRGNTIVAVLDWEGAGLGDPLEDVGYACHPLMRVRAPELMAMLVPIDELERIYEEETGRELDRKRLHYFVIYAVYFHLYTLVSSIVAVTNGADFRTALGYSKYPRATAELVRQMDAWERGSHVL